MRTGVALGSNLGDRLSNLRAARKAILQLAGVTPPIFASAVYETEPINCESDAGKFLNAVLEFDYKGDPLELLKRLGELEQALGRVPDHPRNVSRKIDIDLPYFNATKIEKTELTLQHAPTH